MQSNRNIIIVNNARLTAVAITSITSRLILGTNRVDVIDSLHAERMRFSSKQPIAIRKRNRFVIRHHYNFLVVEFNGYLVKFKLRLKPAVTCLAHYANFNDYRSVRRSILSLWSMVYNTARYLIQTAGALHSKMVP